MGNFFKYAVLYCILLIHSPILNAVPAPRGGGEISLTVFDFLEGDDMFYSALNGER